MKHKSSPFLITFIVAITLCSCNDDVFIEPVVVDVSDEYIPPTGGNCKVKYSGDGINDLKFSVARLADGKKFSIVDGTPDLTVLPNGHKLFKNELIEFSYGIDREAGCLDINVDHSYYSDTIIFSTRVISEYNTVKASAYILPASPFSIADIRYELNEWSSETTEYIASTYIASNNSDQEIELTIAKKGETIAWREAKFEPFEAAISNAILSPYNTSLTFPIPYYTPDMWQPAMSDDKIPYTLTYFRLEGNAIVSDKDYKTKLAPHSKRKVEIAVTAETYGIEYELPAFSGNGTVRLNLKGLLRLRVPLDFNIVVSDFTDQSNQ